MIIGNLSVPCQGICEFINTARERPLERGLCDDIARYIPTPDESMVVIRFKNPRGFDFPYLLSMISQSFMSRRNSIVIPGGKLDLAMQLILTPLILQLVERRRRAS
jgi:phosphoribulokinase